MKTCIWRVERRFQNRMRGEWNVKVMYPLCAFILCLLFSLPGKAQISTPVTGKVTDSLGQPLQGVTVTTNSSKRSALTDNAGVYSIAVTAADKTLSFTYVGLRATTQAITGAGPYNITLLPDVSALTAVVVVGYGTQRREEVTGAISSINSDDIKDQPVTGLQQSMQGKSSGIQITQNSGSPGKNAEVRVRGLTSINNSDVLYVVDGVPLTANGINTIDPNDVASVQILKDASSQAIYGSRGANGVVLVETKKGRKNSSHIYVNAYGGVQQVRKKLDMLNAQEFVQLNTEAFTNAGQPSPWNDSVQYNKTTDWQDAMFQTAPIQNYNIAFSGGSDKLIYRLSGNYLNQDGIITGSSYKRISLSLNTTFQPFKYFEAGENITISKTNQYLVGEGATSRVDLLSALISDPTQAIKDSAGNYLPPRYSDAVNPIASINYISLNHPYNNWSVVGNTYLQLQPVKGLTLRSTLSVDVNFADDKAFAPTYFVSAAQNNPIANISQTKSVGYSWTWDNTATYETKLNGDNEIKILAGISQQQYSFDYIRAANQGQPGNDPYLQYIDAGTANPTVGGRLAQWSLLSYIGRLNYNFKQRYFLTATIRRDGSSKFGANNKYGNFPSASLGWAMSKENFLQNIKPLNYLLLRGSWGKVGNQTSAGYYDFASSINNGFYAFGSTPAALLTAEPNGLGNPDLKWEQVRQWDLGFDFRLFNNSLSGTVDYYNKKTNNMLLSIPILFESGYANGPLTNVASMLNSGFEFQLDYTRSISRNLSLNVGANLATLHNEILSLQNEGAQIFSSPNLTKPGYRAAEFYGYVADGIFQNVREISEHATQPNAAPGDIRFKDLNNDGVINDLDQTFLGTPIPKFTYGFNVGGTFKNFDLNLAFYGVSGNKIYQAYKFNTNGFFVSNYNMEKETLGRWHGEGTSNDIPRLIASDPNYNARASSYYLSDGSFLRLRTVTLGYNVPKKVSDRWNIGGLRLYLSAQNVLTFTKYDGYDPEIGITFGGNAGTLNLGSDNANYPQPRVITAGVNLTL